MSSILALITIIGYIYKWLKYRDAQHQLQQQLESLNRGTGQLHHNDGGSIQQPLLTSSQTSIGSVSSTSSFHPRYSKPKKINNLIFYLSISDFIGCTFLIISQISILGHFEILSSERYCIAMRSLIHFGFLSSFLWTNCIAFYLLRETFEWKPYDFQIWVFHVISWSISIGSIFSLIFGNVIKRSPETGWCSITGAYQLYFWIIPLFLSFLWNLICYIIIYHKFKGILSFGIYGRRSVSLHRVISRKLTFYLLAFLLCWVFDLINHSVYYFLSKCPPFTLMVLQNLFSPLQGTANFIVYSITNKMFH
ncbi:hypothetical protein DLAC_11729 [Tieghemostelium lacteum]|uniref:G-protein coupled receptors family 2 profile 2 domain-containing protein n=1 Tax=Tieghemostelium lacteum TaxID=361077 RepID=A0A151Z871_TIELA|nr:hypothetical protein DLAC_11729 [Tieghemostelium lacteum]|eukprot:KYQ89984.1 hypothetical protein DLAC_11729 [Tieghemostelium lacteum]